MGKQDALLDSGGSAAVKNYGGIGAFQIGRTEIVPELCVFIFSEKRFPGAYGSGFLRLFYFSALRQSKSGAQI